MDAQPLVRVLDPTTNTPVVHIEGRAFPGVLIQGDRLANWARIARRGSAEDFKQLRDEITEMLAHYEHVLIGYGLTLPYSKEI